MSLAVGAVVLSGCAWLHPPPPPAPPAPPPPAAPSAPRPPPPPAPPAPAPAAAKITFAADAYFAPGSHTLDDAGRAQLAQLASKARQVSLEVVIVVGYADSAEAGTGPAAHAQAKALSLRRAEAVKAILVAHGLEANRIYTEARGTKDPVADNRTAEGRAKNRRAEIEVVGTSDRAGLSRAPQGRTIEVLFATSRARTGQPDPEHYFGDDEAAGDAAQRLSLGRAVISVPPVHHRGVAEEPGLVSVIAERITQSSIARALNVPVFTARDSELHFAFARPLELLDHAAFAQALKANIAAARRNEALLYVHGFANSFADAAYRTAQFAYDLTDADHDVAPLMFSWPSDPNKVNYFGAADRAWSAGQQLARLLIQVSDTTGGGVVHIVAHSRGAQVLGIALHELRVAGLMTVRPDGSLGPRFNQIVLAAPDIRASDFESLILPAVASRHQVTNYVASNDEALKLAKRINAGPRAGDSGSGVVLVEGVETIDVSAVKAGAVGHSDFAESKRVLSDIAAQLTGSTPAQRALKRVPTIPPGYWVID